MIYLKRSNFGHKINNSLQNKFAYIWFNTSIDKQANIETKTFLFI